MKQKVIFISDDGQEHETQAAALAHERLSGIRVDAEAFAALAYPSGEERGTRSRTRRVSIVLEWESWKAGRQVDG